jgi:hypothetical protein
MLALFGRTAPNCMNLLHAQAIEIKEYFLSSWITGAIGHKAVKTPQRM